MPRHIRSRLPSPIPVRIATGAALVAFMAALGLQIATPAAQGPATRVLVLRTDDSLPYRKALKGVRETIIEARLPREHVDIVRLTNGLTELQELLDGAGTMPTVVITLGTQATRAVIEVAPDIPIVAGMILTPRALEGATAATGVYLEHAMNTELHWLSQLLPGERRVGILYHSAESAARASAAERLATRGGRLAVRTMRVNSANDIPLALAALAQDADVILGLTDPLVFNAETARAILTFSFRERIPIVGPSAGWVRAGAVYALSHDYEDIGRQTAELALRLLAGQRPSSLAPMPPRKVTYTVNGRTASELRVFIPEPLLRSAEDVIR
jgi:putative ABC transport system substrate-binding protein